MKSSNNEPLRWTFYSMLNSIQRYNSPREIRKNEKIAKSTLYSWLEKLSSKEMITKSFHGHYKLTDKGTDYIDTYEKQDSKNQVRLENMRYTFPIIDGLSNLIKQRKWDSIQPMNNITIYHTKEEGFTVRVIAASNNPCLEVTCRQMIGTDIYEMMYEARKLVECIAEQFTDDYSLILGLSKPAMQPEWAIPNEFAQVLLDKTNSSQITTPIGVINKSKGRGYDIETRDIRLANKLFNLPYVVDEIALQVKSLRVASNTGWFCF